MQILKIINNNKNNNNGVCYWKAKQLFTDIVVLLERVQRLTCDVLPPDPDTEILF